jgi:hypothetical protein
MPRYRAFALACSQTNNTKGHWEAASKLWARNSKVRKRVNELMAKRRKASELSYDDLLNEVLLNSELAKEAGQHAPALTGLKMLGNELFRAFADRREVINLDIRAKSKNELKALMVEELGEDVAEIVWQSWNGPKPKMIEGAVIEPQSHEDHYPDIGINGPLSADVAQPDNAQNRAVEPDSKPARGPLGDMTRHAMQSLDRSKPPKV